MITMNNNNKHIYVFVAAVAIIKIFFAAFIELGNDESYYYTYALQPQLNYFDHPPMVGFLMRLTTLNLAFVNDVTLRLGAIFSCALSSIIIYKTVLLLSNKTAAWYVVLLYNASVYTGVIAGFFILPDSLQMPFWCAALFVMSKIIFEEKETKTSLWLLLGLIIGLAVLCKIHSLYLWAGFGLYVLCYKIKWLLNWRLYISFLITALCCLPILIWNINNNFITYKFHSERVTHTQINFSSLLQEFVGEALYQNPIVYVLLIWAIVILVKKAKVNVTPIAPFLLFLSVPMIFLFWSLSLFNDILPHWSGPAFIPLYILAAMALAKVTSKKYPSILTIATSILAFVFLLVVYLVQYYPANFGNKNQQNFGEGCPTLDISGWKNMSDEFNKIVEADKANNQMKNPVILINKWFPACQFQLYTSTKTKLKIFAVGNLEDVHQFAWLNKTQKGLTLGNDAYCIVPSNQITNVFDAYGKYFEKIEIPQIIEQKRGNKAVRYFYVYRLKNCIKIPAPILP